MIHRFASLRGDPPIPELDVSKPALAPKVAQERIMFVVDRGHPDGDMSARVDYTVENGVIHVHAVEVAAAQEPIEAHPPCTGANDPVAAAPEPAPAEFVAGERVMVDPFIARGWHAAEYFGHGKYHTAKTKWGHIVRVDADMIRRPTAAELAAHWPEDKP